VIGFLAYALERAPIFLMGGLSEVKEILKKLGDDPFGK
jgi:hypothetical protein